jgi:hypothetical protein
LNVDIYRRILVTNSVRGRGAAVYQALWIRIEQCPLLNERAR